MELAQWMSEQGLTDDAFARRIGVERSTMTRLRQKKRRPGDGVCLRIMNETKGAVTLDDLRPELAALLKQFPQAAE